MPSCSALSNSKGRVTYFLVTFNGDKQRCEINPNMATYKGVAKCIVENELIKDEAIDKQAEDICGIKKVVHLRTTFNKNI